MSTDLGEGQFSVYQFWGGSGLRKDRDVLLMFYDFPAEKWKKHLRTTNPIESVIATIRLRSSDEGQQLTPDEPGDDVQAGPVRSGPLEMAQASSADYTFIEGKKFVDGIQQAVT